MPGAKIKYGPFAQTGNPGKIKPHRDRSAQPLGVAEKSSRGSKIKRPTRPAVSQGAGYYL